MEAYLCLTCGMVQEVNSAADLPRLAELCPYQCRFEGVNLAMPVGASGKAQEGDDAPAAR